jgi:hypothetical protein
MHVAARPYVIAGAVLAAASVVAVMPIAPKFTGPLQGPRLSTETVGRRMHSLPSRSGLVLTDPGYLAFVG